MEKQHRKGKLFVTERLCALFDHAAYEELIPPEERDGVYVCRGRVSGKTVIVAAQDFTYMGGSLGLRHGRNIAGALRTAVKQRVPFICINDSGGARIQEGVDSLAAYGELFYQNVQASGVIPQISVIAGPCAGGAVYSPGLTDFVFMIEPVSQMFITGPNVVRSVTGESVTAQELGGAAVHARQSGAAHFRCRTEAECFQRLRELIGLIPPNNRCPPAFGKVPCHHEAREVAIPEQASKPYDVRSVIAGIFDSGSFLEIQEEFAPSAVTGFARLGGLCTGIVANQPCRMAGSLDCDSSDKAARFVRFCDAFQIPIVTLTDIPGYLPGTAQERAGIIRRGAKLLYAFSEATVPRVNVILRKAYGGAYIAMNSLHLGASYVLAWRGAEIAVMGEAGAVEVLYGREAAKLPPGERAAFLKDRETEYRESVMNCRRALAQGYVHEVIKPAETRQKIIGFLSGQPKKTRVPRPKKHGCMPL